MMNSDWDQRVRRSRAWASAVAKVMGRRPLAERFQPTTEAEKAEIERLTAAEPVAYFGGRVDYPTLNPVPEPAHEHAAGAVCSASCPINHPEVRAHARASVASMDRVSAYPRSLREAPRQFSEEHALDYDKLRKVIASWNEKYDKPEDRMVRVAMHNPTNEPRHVTEHVFVRHTPCPSDCDDLGHMASAAIAASDDACLADVLARKQKLVETFKADARTEREIAAVTVRRLVERCPEHLSRTAYEYALVACVERDRTAVLDISARAIVRREGYPYVFYQQAQARLSAPLLRGRPARWTGGDDKSWKPPRR